nr:LytTR family DNA-binding domain-containing protein [Fructobacillus parabroussonetiae]
MEKESPKVLSFKTADGIQLVRMADVIYVDVSKTELLIYTTKDLLVTKGTLTQLLARMKNGNFVQVSKHAAVNIAHLERLENSFSGSMLARN